MRIAESLAKMKLQAVAGEEEVDEALRLFQVSTLDAALSGSLSGVCRRHLLKHCSLTGRGRSAQYNVMTKCFVSPARINQK